MHSVVLIKQVPDTTEVRMDPKTGTLIRTGVPSIVNPYDVHALEEALALRDKYGGRVTVVTMGPPQAKEALRKCISFGADEAILLTDRAFAGSDTLSTSYILTQAVKKISEQHPVDLVLAGKQAIDGDTAQVGPGVATRLGFEQLTYVVKVEGVDLEKKEITVHRLLEEGREVIKTKLPALLTVVKEANSIRYGSLPHVMRAVRYDPPGWNQAFIGGDLTKMGLKGSPTNVKRIFPPPTRAPGEIIPGGKEDPAAAAALLVDKLTARGAVGGKGAAQ